MRLDEADDADHKRRFHEPALFVFDVGCRGARILAREHFGDDVTGAGAGIALETDEAPRLKLAMVRPPGADSQDGFKLGRRGAGTTHLARFHRAADFEEFNGV